MKLIPNQSHGWIPWIHEIQFIIFHIQPNNTIYHPRPSRRFYIRKGRQGGMKTWERSLPTRCKGFTDPALLTSVGPCFSRHKYIYLSRAHRGSSPSENISPPPPTGPCLAFSHTQIASRRVLICLPDVRTLVTCASPPTGAQECHCSTSSPPQIPVSRLLAFNLIARGRERIFRQVTITGMRPRF